MEKNSHLLASFLLALGSILIIYNTLGMKETVLLVILETVILYGGLFLINQYKRSLLTYCIIGSRILGIFLGYTYYHEHINQESIYEWLWHYVQTKENYDKVYAVLTISSVVLGASIISYIGNKWMPAKMFFMIGSTLSLVYMGITKFEASKLGTICLIAYILMILVQWMYDKHYGSLNQEKRQVMGYLMPICVLIGIVSVGLPASEKPLSWKWVENVYHQVEYTMQDLFAEITFTFGGASDEFQLNFIGAESESILGGSIGENNQIMLRVKPNQKIHQPIYLAGSYKDTYTGKSWECLYNEESKGLKEYQLNTYEMLYGLCSGEIDKSDEILLKENILEISYEQIRTRTLFAPTRLKWVNGLSDNRKGITDSSAGISFPKRQKKGNCYELNFLEVNTESDYFKERLRALEDFSYEDGNIQDAKSLLENFKNVDTGFLRGIEEKEIKRQLVERSKVIQEVYTTLPENLPDRIKKLTLEITKGCETKYDQLKAIEYYLKNYQYTKKVEDLPYDQDFVDYFLFETKTGYCTYFASSMAVMARTLDIPTRYVEGFLVDYDTNKYTDVVEVRTEKAHAWVEAYFEGMGWIRFEPTPGYEHINYTDWRKQHHTIQPERQRVAEIEQGLEAEKDQMMEPELEVMQNKDMKEDKGSSPYMAIVIRGIIGIISLVIGIVCLHIRKYEKTFKNADAYIRYKMRFKEIIYLLGCMGLKLQEGETLLRFQDRIIKCMPQEENRIKKLFEAYSRARYSKQPINPSQQEEIRQSYIELCHAQGERYGKVKVAWWRIAYRIYRHRVKNL